MPEDIRRYEEGTVLLINKPRGITSFDVIRMLRKSLGIRKIGHAGTLDPMASGLLVVCTGKFTKRIYEFQAQEKEYTGTITLGATTPSYDAETPADKHYPVEHINDTMILTAAQRMTGMQMQVPPAYSAKKVDGQRAYTLARKGEYVVLPAKEVLVREFEICRVSLPQVDFRVVCSKGTYIRSLAYDFGQKLGSGAYLSALCRTRIGEFMLADAVSPDRVGAD